MAEKALTAVIQETYVQGISTRSVDDLVKAAATLAGCRISIIGGHVEQVARLRAVAPSGGAQLKFLGHLPHAQVALALQSACIAVLPNRDEPDSRFTSPIKLGMASRP